MVYPEVTVCILNFNGLQDTLRCLTSLLQTTYPKLSVHVLDNGSKENEFLILKKKIRSKKVHFFRSDTNRGFAGGNNYLIKSIKTPYVVLLNNDTLVEKSWLKKLVLAMEKDKKIACAQPKIRWMKRKNYFDYAGACGGYLDIFGYPFTRGRIFQTQEKDTGHYDNQTPILWSSGACMIIRRSLYNKAGGLDERFFCYMEEIDLCCRFYRMGFTGLSVPEAKIYHTVAATASKNILKKRFLEHRNNLLLLIKNYPLFLLLLILPIRLVMDYLSVIYYLVSKTPSPAMAVIAAHFSFLFLAPLFLAERMMMKSNTKSIKPYLYPRSVVLDYYLLGKKMFRTLPHHFPFGYAKNAVGGRPRVIRAKKLVQGNLTYS